jgi:hypothetical protein
MALVALGFVALPATVDASILSAPAAVTSRGAWERDPRADRGADAPTLAKAASPTDQQTGSPVPTPGPIVPRGNPVGKVGIVAMVVAAAAGLWIYRVIRKGL